MATMNEYQSARTNAEAAASGDSNDAEIEALQEALSIANEILHEDVTHTIAVNPWMLPANERTIWQDFLNAAKHCTYITVTDITTEN